MKNLKLKRSIYLIITLFVTGFLVTSCEKEIIIEEDVDGVKEIIIEDDVDGFKEMDDNQNVQEPLPELINYDTKQEYNSSAKVACSTIPSSCHGWSRRNCSSKYVYAQHTGNDLKKFELYEWGVSGPVQIKYTRNYYTYFSNLKNGVSYQYKAYRVCPGGNSNQTFSVGIAKGGC